MSLLKGFQQHAVEGLNNPALLVPLVVLSLLTAFGFYILQDFLNVFSKRPSTFYSSKYSWLFTPSVNVPLVKLENNRNVKELLAEGSKEYPDRPFKIQHYPGEIVILPHDWVSHVKNAPETRMSLMQANYDLLVGNHTGIANNPEISSLLRRNIAKYLDNVYDVVEDEAIKALRDEIGPCDDWTELVLFPKLVQIIVRISQRVFVGEPLCRNERWLATIATCSAASFGSVTELWRGNWLTRPLIAWKNPGLRAARKLKEEARGLLATVLEQRLKDMESPGFIPPRDMIQLTIQDLKGGTGRHVDHQLDVQIAAGRAALFTTGMTVFHLLYDLCTHSEYIEPLRAEVLALGQVPMNRDNVAKLTKMDSFIRECQRWSKFSVVSSLRKVIQPLNLPNGTAIPAGTLVAFDTDNAVFNNSTLDNPRTFDGFRFDRLRVEEGNASKFQAVTTGADHLVFGHGLRACPGRFFAIQEVKVTLARILRNYEFKLKDGPPQSVVAGAIGVFSLPNPAVRFLFKDRQVPGQ